MGQGEKFRLVTRSDFDGLVCAMILKEMDLIDEIKFVHPKDVQDGKVDISAHDITTNLPFDPRVGLAFDHHESELTRNADVDYEGRYIIDGDAKSAARVVYDYYGGKEALPRISTELMEAVDKGDSADFTLDEILKFPELYPKGFFSGDENITPVMYVDDITDTNTVIGGLNAHWNYSFRVRALGADDLYSLWSEPVTFVIPAAASGIRTIESDSLDFRRQPIYDLMGRRMPNSWESLPKGIYIINGKKIVK